MATLQKLKVEQLLALFVTRALGLNIEAEICDAKFRSSTMHGEVGLGNPALAVCAAWKAERGTVKICGRYDAEQSQRINEHVILLEWWIEPSAHHVGWYRSSVKHPGEWTRGYGRSSGSAVGGEFEYSANFASLHAKIA